MTKKTINITLPPIVKGQYRWPTQDISSQLIDAEINEICAHCNSAKDETILKLKNENVKLNKVIDFLKSELWKLEEKTVLNERAIPIKDIVEQFSSTQEGNIALEKAERNYISELKKLLQDGQINKIKYYRLSLGMTQSLLANKLKTRQPNIARLEKLGYQPKIDLLKKLATIFNVQLEDLLEK